MADLATLQVRVDAQGAIRTTQQLGDALNKTAQQGPLVSAAMGKTEAQIRRLQMAEVAAYKEAERMANAMQQLGRASENAGRSVDNSTSAMRTMQTVMTAIVGSQMLRGFVNLADSSKLIAARLSLVTESSTELKRVQDALFASAQRTATSYEDVAGLYVRVARNMDTLGKTENELLRFTELVSMQLQIAGATASEASTGVQQLGQALSKGKLDGDEFRTVLEAMPTVADALTKSLAGGVRAELFKLAEQGKITGSDIVDALLKIEMETREKFTKMPETVGKAFTQMKNDALRAIGDIDRELNASSKIADLLRGFGILARFGAALLPGGAGATGENAVGVRVRRVYTDLRREQLGLTEGHTNATSAAMARLFPAPKPPGLGTGEVKKDELQKALDKFEEDFRKINEEAFRNRVDAMVEQAAAEEEWVRTVNERLLTAYRNAEEEAARLRAEAADFELTRQIERDHKVAMEKIKLDMEELDRNEQLAKNFRDNIQQSLGQFFTDFVQTGRVSIQSLFQGIGGIGANMAGQGLSRLITGMLPKTMGPFGSILAGLGLSGLGSLFGRNRGPAGPTAEEKLAQAQGRYASIELLRQQRADEMRQFIEGRSGAASRGVVQSIGTVLQETTASRMIGELVAIRVATRQTADAVRGTGGTAGTGTVVNVTVQGGAMATGQEIGEKVAEAVDRLLGTKVQTLRLTSGAAVVS